MSPREARIDSLIDPPHVAVLCMEMQRGVVGDLSGHPAAAAVQATGMVTAIRNLMDAARSADIRIIHCTARFRPDRVGSFSNMPAINQLLDNPDHLLEGSPATEVIPELWSTTDLESYRYHGISPWADTALDTMLRSIQIRTIVATGVSLNRGITGMTIEAVNRGYHVIIPKDCVIGYPREYGELILNNTLAAISTITTAGVLTESWSIPSEIAGRN